MTCVDGDALASARGMRLFPWWTDARASVADGRRVRLRTGPRASEALIVLGVLVCLKLITCTEW